MKILDFLIENDRTSWKLTEIMYHAKVGHSCSLVVLNDLVDLGILKLERKKYSLDKENKFTKLLTLIYKEINLIRLKGIEDGLQKKVL